MSIKKLISAEWFFPIVLSAVFILISLIPLFHRYNSTPQDKFFNGTYFYSDDYGYYASVIKQGIDGNWLVADKYTNEAHSPSIMHEQYLLLGKVGSILNLSAPITFHLGRALGGFLFLLVAYALIQKIFLNKSARYLAFLATFLASGIPFKITDNSGRSIIQIPVYWFTELNPFERLTPLFHYSLGWILLFAILILFTKIFNKPFTIYHLLLTIVFGILVSISHPSTLLIVYLTLGMYLVIKLIVILVIPARQRLSSRLLQARTKVSFRRERSEPSTNDPGQARMTGLKRQLKILTFVLIFIIFTIPPLFYLKSLRLVFPWNAYLSWEKNGIVGLPIKDYVLSIGPVFFLGIIGIILFIKEMLLSGVIARIRQPAETKQSILTIINPQTFLILISYVISVFLLLYPLQNYIGINPVRIMQTPIHIPFAVFSVFTTLWLIDLFKRKSKKPDFFKWLIYVGTFSTLLLTFIPVFSSTLTYTTHLFDDYSALTYPSKKTVDAYAFLSKNTPRNSTVLATYTSGNQIPYLSGNTVFLGHLYNTYNYYKKGDLANNFYQEIMTNEEAKKFLEDNKIDYVFYGPGEKMTGTFEKYTFLKDIFKNEEVTIYKTK